MRAARSLSVIWARALNTASSVGSHSKKEASSFVAQRTKIELAVWFATMPSSPPSLKNDRNSATGVRCRVAQKGVAVMIENWDVR